MLTSTAIIQPMTVAEHQWSGHRRERDAHHHSDTKYSHLRGKAKLAKRGNDTREPGKGNRYLRDSSQEIRFFGHGYDLCILFV